MHAHELKGLLGQVEFHIFAWGRGGDVGWFWLGRCGWSGGGEHESGRLEGCSHGVERGGGFLAFGLVLVLFVPLG